MRAGGGNAGGSGIEESSYAADRNGCAGVGVGVEEINALRPEIGDYQLRGVRGQGETAERGIWRRAAWRCQRGGVKLGGGQIENVDVVGGGEVKPLAFLVIKNKFVQGRLGEDLRGLCIEKRAVRFAVPDGVATVMSARPGVPGGVSKVMRCNGNG